MYRYWTFLAFSVLLTIGTTLCKDALTDPQTGSNETSTTNPKWLPTNFKAVPSGKGMKLTWNKPTDAGATGYFLSYADLGQAPLITNIKFIDNETHYYPQLKPWTNYTFGLMAYKSSDTGLDFGDKATTKETTFMQNPGAVRELNITDVHSTTMTIEWKEPDEKNGPIYGYTIGGYNKTETMDTTARRVTLTDLKPYQNYSISVLAYNYDPRNTGTPYVKGPPESKHSFTCPSEPDVVQNLALKEKTKNSLSIEWGKPKTPNGPIAGYIISHGSGNISDTQVNSFTFNDLHPGTTYQISVKAYNHDCKDASILEGKEVVLNLTTCASEPDAVLDLSLKGRTNTSLEIVWGKPTTPNGPIAGYLISCNSGNNSDTKETTFTCNDLHPGTTYQISVKAYNHDCKDAAILEGKEAVVNHTTFASVPPKPNNITFQKSTTTEIEFKAPKSLFSSENGDIIENVLLVAEGDTMGLTWDSKYEPLQDMQFKNWTESKNSKNMYRSSPQKWKMDSANSICKIQKNDLLCTVGSQSDCGKEHFCNGPLRKKTTYRIKVRGYTEAGWTETNAIEATTASGERAFAMTGLIAFSVMTVIFAHP